MKKVNVTNEINKYLVLSPIRFEDLYNQRKNYDSYEKYVQDFKLCTNTYKENIPEFFEIALDYLNKMNDFVKECMKIQEESLHEYIARNLKMKIRNNSYSESIKLDIIFPTSLLNTTEKCENTIIQVYKELGYDNLRAYIQLLNNPGLLTSYLNDSQKQIVGMNYILYKTNHHSNTKFSRNLTVSNLYKLMDEKFQDSVKEIVSEKDDYIHFMDVQKENYNTWFKDANSKYCSLYDESKEKYDLFMEESNRRLNNLEETYSEKLKVEEPSNFMLDKAEEYRKKTKYWTIATVILTIILLLVLGFILSPELNLSKKIITINLFSNDMSIPSSIIILAMVCLIIYVIRVFIKLTLSSKHLSEEYKQKYILTYFYLSLINKGKIDNKNEIIILTTLFSKSDTGLIKSDNAFDYESMMKILTSYKNN